MQAQSGGQNVVHSVAVDDINSALGSFMDQSGQSTGQAAGQAGQAGGQGGQDSGAMASNGVSRGAGVRKDPSAKSWAAVGSTGTGQAVPGSLASTRAAPAADNGELVAEPPLPVRARSRSKRKAGGSSGAAAVKPSRLASVRQQKEDAGAPVNAPDFNGAALYCLPGASTLAGAF